MQHFPLRTRKGPGRFSILSAALDRDQSGFFAKLGIHPSTDPENLYRNGEECEIFISAFDEWLADTIDGLEGLETVRFHLDQDLMAGDLTFLNQFRNSTGIEITLKVETSAGYNRNGSYCHDVRMYRDLVPKIRKWGWRVTGQPELVGKSHRFRNQKAWVEELKEDDERAVGFHMRKQSAFITVKS